MGAARFRKDDGLLHAAKIRRFGKGDIERFQKCLAFGVVLNGSGKPGELIEVGDLLLQRCTIAVRKRRGGFVVDPLLGGLFERLIVLVQLLFKRFRRLLFAELLFQARGNGAERSRDCESRRGEQLAQHQSHQRALACRKRLKVVAL